jgi:hypothetical protein
MHYANITTRCRISKHKFKRLSYVREHRKIQHKTSTNFIVKHRLNNRHKIQAISIRKVKKEALDR